MAPQAGGGLRRSQQRDNPVIAKRDVAMSRKHWKPHAFQQTRDETIRVAELAPGFAIDKPRAATHHAVNRVAACGQPRSTLRSPRRTYPAASPTTAGSPRRRATEGQASSQVLHGVASGRSPTTRGRPRALTRRLHADGS